MPNGTYGGVRGGLNSPYSIYVDLDTVESARLKERSVRNYTRLTSVLI